MQPSYKTNQYSTPIALMIIWFILFINVSRSVAQSQNRSSLYVSESIIDKARSAAIKMFDIDSITKQQNIAPFSGVVVSEIGRAPG